MLTDRQKILLAMQSNLDQMAATIRQGLEHSECVGQSRTLAEELGKLIAETQAGIEHLCD